MLDPNKINQVPDFTVDPTPIFNGMEVQIPRSIDIGITGKDGRSYKCKVETIAQTCNISVNPMFSVHSAQLDLNDREYLEWYLTVIVNGFIDRYKDTTTPRLVKQIQTLVENTVITNHFDYITFSKDILTITESILSKDAHQ